MNLEYQLIRSRKRKKTLSLKITGTGQVVVQAPYHTPAAEITAFLERKRAWLEEKLRQLREAPAVSLPKSLESGETLLYLGVPYPLVIEDHGNPITLFALVNQTFVLNERMRHHGKILIREWYVAQARSHFPERVARLSQAWGLTAKAVRISNAGSRWGSCSPADVLSLSWRLMMAPPAVIDYVIVHELAHIREKNHSRTFWHLVSVMMPDYRIHRRWLKENGGRLCL